MRNLPTRLIAVTSEGPERPSTSESQQVQRLADNMHGLATDPAPLEGHDCRAPGSKGENSSGRQTATPGPYRESAPKGNGENGEATDWSGLAQRVFAIPLLGLRGFGTQGRKNRIMPRNRVAGVLRVVRRQDQRQRPVIKP